MSKFQNTLVEAAYAVAGHGFAQEESGNVEELTGWNALVSVNATVLINLGEDELHERYTSFLWLTVEEPAGFFVWIRQDNQGFVKCIEFGTDSSLVSGTDKVNADWDAFVESQDEVEVDYV
jgi:hypothetical protein